MQLSCLLITNFKVTINAYYIYIRYWLQRNVEIRVAIPKSRWGQGSATFCTATYARSGHCLSSDGVWGPRVPAGSAAAAILAAGLI
jgi:hypothetical protein